MTHRIIDFASADVDRRWAIVNDDVMGGCSASTMRVTREGFGVFSGVLSLKNNGGFASTRLPLPAASLGEYDGLVVRLQGDGRTYRFRLRTSMAFDDVAYQREFCTTAGEWMEITLPFAEFVASYRGRLLPERGPINASDVQQIGILVADKQAGPFELTIAWIAAYRNTDRLSSEIAPPEECEYE